MVFAVLGAIREDAGIAAAVEELDGEEVDVLMKYVYKGLSVRVDLAAALLKWHAAATRKSGIATIVRTLTDRRGL